MADNAMRRVVTLFTTIFLRLRTGAWVEAAPLALGEYIVKGEGDEHRLVDINQVEAIAADHSGGAQILLTQTESEELNKKGGVMDTIYHFMHKDNLGRLTRVITNNPTAEQVLAHDESLTINQPINGLLAVHMGNQRFHLLQGITKTFGVPFTIEVIELKKFSHRDLVRKVRTCTFATANAKYGFFVNTPSHEFGLHLFDMVVNEAKKTTKRLAELSRATELGHFITQTNFWNIQVFETPEGEDEKYYDGVVAIHPRVIARSIKQCFDNPKDRARVGRKFFDTTQVGMFRACGYWGTIKGRYIVAPDLECDILTHSCNVKAEVLYNSYSCVTLWPEGTEHTASYDSMSTVNLGSMLTQEAQENDLKFMVDSWTDSLNRGELPEWLHKGQPEHTDDGVPVWDDRLSNDYGQVAVRLNAHIPASIGGVTVSANIVRMAAMGLALEMKAGLKPLDREDPTGEQVWKRMAIPMRNAFNAPSVSWSAITKMAGIQFPDQDGTRMFHHPQYGLIWPDARFAETYDLHDGHDLDDHHSVKAVRLFSSSPAATELYKECGVLGKGVTVPGVKNQAMEIGLVWRLPNGPGSYSFTEIDFDTMPWHALTEIETIDLASCPTPLPVLQGINPVIGFPAGRPFQGQVDAAKAAWTLITQRDNPGVGLFMNRITAIAHMNGGYLPNNLPATTSDMIDVVNQGGRRSQFKAILDFVADADRQMFKLTLGGAKIDLNILLTRCSKRVRKGLRGRASTTTNSRYAVMAEKYGDAVLKLETDVMNKTLEMRSHTLLIKWLRGLNFQGYVVWAARTVGSVSEALHAVDVKFNQDILMAGDDPFLKIAAQRAKTIALRAEIDGLLMEIEGMANPGEAALALWKQCVAINGRNKYGMSDRVIFQQGTTHAVMDLALGEMVNRKVISKPEINSDADLVDEYYSYE